MFLLDTQPIFLDKFDSIIQKRLGGNGKVQETHGQYRSRDKLFQSIRPICHPIGLKSEKPFGELHGPCLLKKNE